MVQRIRFDLLILFTVVVGLGPALAGPLPIGSIVGSKNAILNGEALLPNTTVLSGDLLQVDDGLAMVTLHEGNRMILGRQTEASFSQEADGVTVSLARGNVSLYHPKLSTAFQVKVGDVTVVPAQGYKTYGEVAMVDGLLLVTAKNGTLQVEKAGTTKEVSAGNTITIATTAAGAPSPDPSGNRHLKHILHVSPEALLILGLAGEAGGAAAAIVLASRTPQEASPVAPGP